MRKKISKSFFLPTGSTLLNLRLNGTPFGGFPEGKIINVCGDSFAGKTLLAWTMFAEICNDPSYDEYTLYYDEPEASLSFDLEDMFGRKTAGRVITGENNSTDKYFADSDTVQQFGRQLDRIINKGKKFVYVLDSFDTLDLETKTKKKIGDGGYEGAKKNAALNEVFRKTNKRMKRLGATLIIVSQVRDNLNAMFGPSKTRTGGRAMKHYAAQEMWLFQIKSIKSKTTKTEQESEVLVKVTKNRHAKNGLARLHISWKYGIDDIQANVD